MILISSWSRLCPILWSQVLSREWRCSWSSADRRCSNYSWVINSLIAYQGASYIRDLTVYGFWFENSELWCPLEPAVLKNVELPEIWGAMVFFGGCNESGKCCHAMILYVTGIILCMSPSQWEMALQCNAMSHWLGTYTEWSLCYRYLIYIILY